MPSSEDAIKRVVEAFERSDWSEIDIRSGSVRIHLATGSTDVRPAPARRDDPTAAARDDEPAPPDTGSPAVTRSVPAGSHDVVSPSPGIFWCSPEPGLPPFVELGDVVDSSATVCIVEVMKLMNHVKAGVSGEVVAVYGQNGVAVRKGEALFSIAENGS